MNETFEPIDFHDFHRHELPERLRSGHGEAAAAAVRRFGSLAFRLPAGDAYTYVPGADGIEVVPGDAAADTVIEIGQEEWQGIVHELETAPGLLYAGRVRCARGKPMKMVAWEPGLRAIYNGRPIFDPSNHPLSDRNGDALDPEQAFVLGDDRDDMAHFLRTTGYLFVRDVFAADEVAGFLEDARALRGEAVKGDKLSWWGRNAAGDEVLCRVTRGASRPRLASIPADGRLLSIVALADEPLAQRPPATSGEGISVIYKNPGMTEGLSDIPWHRDCGMGGHAVLCPILIASVYLTEATPETGELKMLPGSWQGSMGYVDPRHENAPRGASFLARPGDVSFHYGDVMHAAPPPTNPGRESYRISAVTAYVRPGARPHRGKRGYNEVLHQREDGQVEHLADVAERRR